MSREILFKGKRVSNGEWVEGYIVKRPTGEWQIERRCDNPPDGDPMWKKVLITYEVKPDTICQYTGLKDKNGKKIWENDVVFVTDEDGCSGRVDTCIGEIEFYEGLWYINGRVQNGLYDIDKCFHIEVIGNIFDNPELLKGGVEE